VPSVDYIDELAIFVLDTFEESNFFLGFWFTAIKQDLILT
jgi:hypothetical protein